MPPLALSLWSWLEIGLERLQVGLEIAQLMSRRVHKDPARAILSGSTLICGIQTLITIVKATVNASMATAKVYQTARESHFRRPSMNASSTTRAINAAFMSRIMPSAPSFAKRMQSAEESACVTKRMDIARELRNVNYLPKRNHGA